MYSELASPETDLLGTVSLPVPGSSVPRYLSRLHLTVDGVGDRSVLVDPRASIRQLVTALGGGRSNGLRVVESDEVLAPGAIIGYCRIRSGDRVEFADDPAATDTRPVHVLRFLSGPRAGERLVLPAGETRIGRAADNDVVIVDPSMSRHHALLTVDGDVVMLADAGSTNGVMIDDRMISGPTPLPLGTSALVGQSWFAVSAEGRGSAPRQESPYNGVIGASNRLELTVLQRPIVPYIGDCLEFPTPPERPRLARLRNGQESFETAVEAFEHDLIELEAGLEETQRLERQGRLLEAPSIHEVMADLRDDVANAWGASVAGGVAARVGLANRPTRIHMLVPGASDPDLRDRLTRLAHDHELIEAVPAVVRFDHTPVSLHGPRSEVVPLAYSLVGQLAARHRPSEFRIWAMVAPERVDRWDWLKWLPHCSGIADDTMSQLASTDDGFERLVDDISSLVDPGLFPLVVVDATLPELVKQSLVQLCRDHAMSVLVVRATEDHPGDSDAEADDWACSDEECVIEIEGDSASMSNPLILGIGHETATRVEMENTARRLAPVVESDQLTARLAPIPGGCADTIDDEPLASGTLGDVLRGNDPAIVPEQWDQTVGSNLTAVIGHDQVGPVEMALESAGPHAIVAGHCECFLPAWLTRLAAAYSPQRLNFFLFDSQDGLVFRECRSLPHCVGVVDDMSPVAVKAALAALSAELDRRESVLANVGMESIRELEQQSRAEYVLPRLVVMVDQLCRLSSEGNGVNPVAELVQLAARGHHLGLHLVVGIGSDSIHESDVVVLGNAPEDVRDLADINAVIISLPRPGLGRIRLLGEEPRRFQPTVAGRRPEIVVDRFQFDNAERLYRGPIKIAYQDDLARLITQVSKAYDYAGGVRPSWLV